MNPSHFPKLNQLLLKWSNEIQSLPPHSFQARLQNACWKDLHSAITKSTSKLHLSINISTTIAIWTNSASFNPKSSQKKPEDTFILKLTSELKQVNKDSLL